MNKNCQPLNIRQAPMAWILQHEPFFEEKLRRATPAQREELWETENLLYESDRCGGVEPMYQRICRTCKLEFTTFSFLKKHLSTYEHTVNRCKKKGLPIPPDPLRCTVCEITFASSRNLKKHLKTKLHLHKVKAPIHKCDLCNRTFKNRRQLTKHIRVSKEHQKNLKGTTEFCCQICTMNFKNQKQLNKHETTSKRHKKNCENRQKNVKIV